MPFPLLAHQAPVLPLKARWPAAFNGTALVVGSVAPDLQNFWASAGNVDWGHTFVGQFTFCLPLTLGVVLLVGHLRLGEVIASRLGRRVAWLAGAATDVARPGGFERATMSALCGSFSHLAFDELTHEMPARGAHAVLHLAGLALSMHVVAQGVASLLGTLVSLWLLQRMGLHVEYETQRRRGGASVLILCALAGGVFGVVRALPRLRHPDQYFDAIPFYVTGYTVFLVVTGAAAGVLVAATLLAGADRLRSARSSQPEPDQLT